MEKGREEGKGGKRTGGTEGFVIIRRKVEGDHHIFCLRYTAGEMRAERALMNLEFTFDLFVCVAILTMHSNKICCATDAASVYGCLNRWVLYILIAGDKPSSTLVPRPLVASFPGRLCQSHSQATCASLISRPLVPVSFPGH